MLKAPAMILGVKGPSNQHCRGGGGGMRESAVFLQKCPKTFGQDCSLFIYTSKVLQYNVKQICAKKVGKSPLLCPLDFKISSFKVLMIVSTCT